MGATQNSKGMESAPFLPPFLFQRPTFGNSYLKICLFSKGSPVVASVSGVESSKMQRQNSSSGMGKVNPPGSGTPRTPANPGGYLGMTSPISFAFPDPSDVDRTHKLIEALKPHGCYESEEELNHRYGHKKFVFSHYCRPFYLTTFVW